MNRSGSDGKKCDRVRLSTSDRIGLAGMLLTVVVLGVGGYWRIDQRVARVEGKISVVLSQMGSQDDPGVGLARDYNLSLLSTTQVAQKLEVPPAEVRRMIYERRIDGFKDGGRWWIPAGQDFEAALAKMEGGREGATENAETASPR